MTGRRTRMVAVAAGAALGLSALALTTANAQPSPEMAAKMAEMKNGKSDFPDFEKVIEGFEKVVSTADGESFYDIYRNDKDGTVLAVLPRNFEKQTCFVAPTFAEGMPGAQSSMIDGYMVKWKKINDRLALIQPNLDVRSTGDNESQRSRDSQFTDRVVTDVPIVSMAPGNRPVINMTDLLVKDASKLLPFLPRFNSRLTEIVKTKAFPENVELAFRAPTIDGTLVTMHYSWSVLPENTGYKPREADYRVGYFLTPFNDLAKIGDQTLTTRYINRWKVEKADPSLKLSPPKEPIVFYIEHTTPIQYRQAVREGILEWNKAYEQVGIVNAIEVYQQDSRTGAHMEKDPEDVRFNFARWSSNNQSFAIGPLRADPRTGQIVDADILMNDGWIRAASSYYEKVMADMATETMTPETLAWLDSRPEWDPRIMLHAPAERDRLMAERKQMLATTGPRPHGGHPVAVAMDRYEKSRQSAGLWSSSAQMIHTAMCSYAEHRAMDMSLATLNLINLDTLGSNGRDIDDVPDEFVNALITDVIMHEIGHVLGLRHNFVASTIYTIEEINDEAMAGQAFTGSVMDYNAVNYQFDLGDTQGDYFMPTIGPYDVWAIRYGYADDKEVAEILKESTDPLHIYHSDEHLSSPDPRVRQRDMGGNVLDFVESELRLIQDLRSKILERSVKEGQSWQRVRMAYQSLLNQHFRNVMTSANWIGSSIITRDQYGDAERDPITPVDAADQRRALELVIAQTFYDDSFGLTPELLAKMMYERNFDQGFAAFTTEETWNVHDNVLAIQNAAMTLVMNPTTLRRVLDNEFKIPADEDALTLAEMMSEISESAWSELDGRVSQRHTARDPMISSLRRNLQSQHVDRLIDLSLPGALPGAASKPIADLATWQLREISEKIGSTLDSGDSMIDPYTMAHLSTTKEKIDKALDAQFVYNRDDV